MPYLPTAQEWLTQSALLMQARPTTTRITTKYTILSTTHTKSKSLARTKAPPPPAGSADTIPPPPPATLTLKTHDTASGTTLKYETNKGQEVGRLVAAMARLGRGAAGLEVKGEDTEMKEEDTASGAAPVASIGTNGSGAPPQGQQQSGGATGGGGGGGGKKKKKGKR